MCAITVFLWKRTRPLYMDSIDARERADPARAVLPCASHQVKEGLERVALENLAFQGHD